MLQGELHRALAVAPHKSAGRVTLIVSFAGIREPLLKLLCLLALLCTSLACGTSLACAQMPHLEQRGARHALIVDGKPYLMLGAQINNSSSWAATLPRVWPALEAMHVNTVEAPVYWEQMEPTKGTYDFSGVDLLVQGARAHHLRLVVLWFGTWKNGQSHYVPEWVKTDPGTYPRAISPDGKLLDVLSPNSPANLQADQHAFAAMMRHLRETDSDQHTVLMIQVENETGLIGTVRDHSAMADKEFAQLVPAALHASGSTWAKAYGAAADERFAAYSVARYVNAVAAAGKAEYPLPMYCNVWITYPVHALENRDHPSPGQEYPSGGPQQQNLAIWKAAAPALDLLGPDFYSDDRELFRQVVTVYDRPDNSLFIPETHLAADFGPNLFYALGHGAIGFSPFGIDRALPEGKLPAYLTEDFTLLLPLEQQMAQWNLAGQLQTAVEQPGQARQRVHFAAANRSPAVDAVVSYGFPQRDGQAPPGTPDFSGRALIAQTGPLEFVVTGFNASVSFELPEGSTSQLEILRAEEGTYTDGTWVPARIWNGDQTDRGLNFKTGTLDVVRIRLHTLALREAGRR